MSVSTASQLTVAELQRLLQQAEPAVLLVPPRILRRVIKKDRQLPGPGLQVPHRKSYCTDRAALLRVVDRSELGLAAAQELPDTLVLLPIPDAARLAAAPPAITLQRYWRLLFHARVHLALAQRHLDDAAIDARIARIGLTEFDEIHAVLRQEHFLLPPGDSATVYEEFAALYLELRYFASVRLGDFFPGLTDFAAIDLVLAHDVDADALFAATRIDGAADPVATAPVEEDERDVEPEAPAVQIPPTEDARRALLARADRAAARGNRVRAAILRQRADARDAAVGEIEHLLTRLRQALSIPESDVDAWRGALVALLAPAAAGLWPIEARVLYDLQKVCIDREHDIYAVDLVEWFVSWGRRPIKRLLANQPLIQTVKHLRHALHRLSAVRIAEPVRLVLLRLVQAAVDHNEHELRERFHPIIVQALDRVGLQPGSYAERVSRDKLIAELLDRVVERRFLGMGDLRDAIARNELKLPDLAGLGEFLLGDKLIRANRQFADDLDGVYRRGEIYLRWLQRLSSMAFGTPVGRFLVLFLVLPFGGAYLGLEAVHHVLELFHKHEGPEVAIASAIGLVTSPMLGLDLAASAILATQQHETKLVNPYSVGALGLFLFTLLHFERFRREIWRALVRAWHAGAIVLFEWPAALLRIAWVRAVLESWPYLLFYYYVLKAIPWAAAAGLTCYLLGLGTAWSLVATAATFIVASALYNSRLGMYLEEVATDGAIRTWHLFQRDLVPGLFRLVMFVFKRLLEDVERVLYAVDELLRFRTGDSRWSLVWKPALGLVWFAITYVIRLIINLFVEPTFNPIKHFPVVTVTAKLIVPVIRPLTHLVMVPLVPLVGRPLALALAGVVIFFLPGLAGFLVWELKENWRLYRSNRPINLQPVVVGSHGETVLRFLRPGLHSGTVPKLYARLRRRRGTAAHKQSEALHHVAASLHHFVERDLIAVLAGSKRWAGVPIAAEHVRLATNRIRFELRCPTLEGGTVCIDLAERGGWLLAGLALPAGGACATWLARLQPAQTAALRDALAGFYKLAGVERLCEQVDAALPADTLPFAEMALPWLAWVTTWELDQAGKPSDKLLLDDVRLLPSL